MFFSEVINRVVKKVNISVEPHLPIFRTAAWYRANLNDLFSNQIDNEGQRFSCVSLVRKETALAFHNIEWWAVCAFWHGLNFVWRTLNFWWAQQCRGKQPLAPQTLTKGQKGSRAEHTQTWVMTSSCWRTCTHTHAPTHTHTGSETIKHHSFRRRSSGLLSYVVWQQTVVHPKHLFNQFHIDLLNLWIFANAKSIWKSWPTSSLLIVTLVFALKTHRRH